MEHHGFLLALLVLSTMMLVCLGAELKVVDSHSEVDQNNTSSGSKEIPVDQKKKSVDQIAETQGGTKNVADTKDLHKGANSKDDPKVGIDKDHTSDKPLVRKGDTKEGAKDGSEAKVVPKGVTTEKKSDPLKPGRKESARGEECGSSSTCTDEKNKLIACLRVPGHDSPELSLLIQNKGTNPLSVKITAPDYVRLENNSVQIPEKENKEVTVSIGKENKNTFIVLTVKDSNCTIDFSDLILHNSGKNTNDIAKSSLINIRAKVPLIVLVSIVALMLVGSAWTCVRFRQKQVSGDGSKYQKLETELPVSGGGGKKGTDDEDGWEENWGDSWDDEEAPKTPAMPITPSLSSKGLASRKLSKDAWKD